jgi:hypothetical protein
MRQDIGKFLGCEDPTEKRERTLREKIAAERKYCAARDALDSFEKIVHPLIEDEGIRLRRAELRRTRQTAIDEMKDAQEAYRFAEKITREDMSATRPPRYKPELDKHDGSWTRR